MASSKLPPSQLMKATRMFWPSASSPFSVEELSAMRLTRLDLLARLDAGALVDAGVLVERTNFRSGYSSSSLPSSSAARSIRSAGDDWSRRRRAGRRRPGRSRARPGPPCRCRRCGASGTSSGTAWRCMLAPIRARLASSCSRNGISAVATETTCFGRDVHVVDWSTASGNPGGSGPATRSSTKSPSSSSGALACAMT